MMGCREILMKDLDDQVSGGDQATFLLHACCAPCFTHPFRLLRSAFRVTAYFYNPNIQPETEYRAREGEMRRLAEKWRAPLIVGDYDVEWWRERVRGLEDEPEGGRRCEVCYRLRLEATARAAAERGMEVFGTTLSISPLKKAATINRIGREVGEAFGVSFYEADFKKCDGFKISCRLSAEEALYRQNYCGCLFSRREGS